MIVRQNSFIFPIEFALDVDISPHAFYFRMLDGQLYVYNHKSLDSLSF